MKKNIVEPHHLLERGTAGIKTYRGGEAMGQRISDWLAHPVGSIADNPTWGHNLESLKFEPESANAEVMYEMSILAKLTADVEDLNIRSIKIKYASIDEINIVITDNHGEISTQLPIL